MTLVAPDSPLLEPVNDTNCVNSSDIGFAEVYTVQTLIAPDVVAAQQTSKSGANALLEGKNARWAGWLVVGSAVVVGTMLL